MLTKDTMIQMFDKQNILVCEDTVASWLENNSEDEDVVEGIFLLRHFDEIELLTSHGAYTLKVKDGQNDQ